MNYKNLIKSIQQTHQVFQRRTVVSINHNLIVRNWLFGFFIVEFEQNGKDYAKYGERLLYRLADELKKRGLKGVAYTNLTLFRKFYLYYPQFGQLVKDISSLPVGSINLQSVAEDLVSYQLPPEKLISKLSFTHFVELLKIDNPLQRLFYEIESIKGTWSRRELHRQINSLLYERTELSTDKAALLSQIEGESGFPKPSDIIRDPYIFEFLDIN